MARAVARGGGDAMTSRALFAPEVVQTSAMDCGPAALKSLLGGLGLPIGYDRLREACQTDVDGTSIDTIEDLAVSLGADAEQLMLPVDHVPLPASESLPAIAVVNLPNGLTHFVVLWRRHGPLVQVMDPAGGRRWVTSRELVDELYRHTMAVPAEAFREYAGTPEFVGPLEQRLVEIGIGATVARALVAGALEDPGWRAIGALDATVRMARTLLRSGGIAAADVEGLVRRFYERAREDASVVPPDYWIVGAHEDDEQVLFRGAVLVRARTLQGRPEGAPPLPADLATALDEKPQRPLARLISMLREDGLAAPIAVLAALALAAVGAAVEALVLRGAIDLADRLQLPEQRLGIGLATIGLLVLLFALQLPVSAATLRLGRHLEARLRVAWLHKIPRLDERYFHSRLTSDMAQRAHSVHALRTFASVGASFISGGFSLVATVACVIWLDPGHALSAIAVAILAVSLPLALQPLWRERDLRVQTHFGALTRFYLDALLGLVPLRAHGAERALRREHEGLLCEWERASRGLLRAMVATDVVLAVSGVALTAWLLFGYLGGGGALAGALLLVYWALRIPALGQQVAQSARQYPHLRNIALRLLEPLGAPEQPRAASIDPARGGAVSVRFDGVSVRAGGREVLEDVSLEIAPGTRVAIVGASGAGKSTLVGLLLGWHKPYAGQLVVDGELLGSAELDALRRRTAWVDPTIQLWNRSLARNLRYGSAESGTSVGHVVEAAGLLPLLDVLPEGLSTVLGEGGALVSGGEGQRVRLGRAMLRDEAGLVILDEPFRGLDRDARRHSLRASLAHFAGATVLCVTHDVADVVSTFERVVVVHEGRVVEDGAPSELLARQESQFRALVDADRALGATTWDAAQFRRATMVDGTLEETER